jgi:hypothetical protein
MDIFFAEMSRPALRPTKPRVQIVPVATFEGSNRPGREAAAHFHLLQRLKKVQLSFHFSKYLDCVVINSNPTL